jgi:hypothetical protein
VIKGAIIVAVAFFIAWLLVLAFVTSDDDRDGG